MIGLRLRLLKLAFLILLLLVACNINAQSDSLRFYNEDTLLLTEVVIKARVPISIRKDTITYSVDSFYRNSSASAQELFRRLPGFEIGENGEYRIQGQPIAKTFINGKEYNLSDLTILFKQLPASFIDKIKVANWVDEEFQFAGIKNNSAKKSINILLDDDKIGDINIKPILGYGTKERYFGNIFGYIQKGKMHSAFNVFSTNAGVDDLSAKVNILQAQATPGIKEDKRLSLIVNFDTIGKSIINMTYEFCHVTNIANENLIRNTYIDPETELVLRQNNKSNGTDAKHTLKLQQKSYFSKAFRMLSDIVVTKNSLNYYSLSNQEYYYSDNRPDSVNRELSTMGSNFSTSALLSNNMQWKFSNAKRLVYFNQEIRMSEDLRNNSVAKQDVFEYLQNQSNRKEYLGSNNITLGIQYIEHIGTKHSLLCKISGQSGMSKNVRNVQIGIDKMPDNFQSTKFQYRTTLMRYGFSHQYSNDILSSSFSIDIQNYRRNLFQNISGNVNHFQSLTNILPSLSFRYVLSGRSSLLMNANTIVVFPEFNQLQSTPDYLDSFNIYIGNPMLRPENKIASIITYNYVGASANKMIWCSFGLNLSNHKIVHSIEIVKARSTMKPVNIGKTHNVFVSGNYSRKFSKALKFTAGLQIDNSMDANVVANKLIQIHRVSGQPYIKIESSPIGKNFETGFGYQNKMSNIIYNSEENIFSNIHTVSNNCSFYLPHNFILSYDIGYVMVAGIATQSNSEFFTANFVLEKGFDRPNRFCLRVQLFDLFNAYPNFLRKFGDSYYEDLSFKRIGRFALLSASYSFTR